MKKSLTVSAGMVIAALLLLLFGLNGNEAAPPAAPGAFVLLAQHDTGTFLMQVKQGAQQAAQEAGASLALETMEAEDSLAAARWKERGCSGVLLMMGDESAQRAAQALEENGVPWIGIWDTAQDTGVSPDEKQTGELLAAFAAGYPKAYLSGDAPERLAGFLAAYQGEPVHFPPDALPREEGGACVIALTGEETLRLAQLKKQGAFSAPLAGMDPGEERVALMEQELVQGLAFHQPYAMGYGAVKALLAGSGAKKIPGKMVLREEMYLGEHVKSMFPLLN